MDLPERKSALAAAVWALRLPGGHGKNVRKALELVVTGGGGGVDDEGGGEDGGGDDEAEVGVTSTSIHRFSPPSWVSHALGYVGLVPPVK